ncbi:MAG: hypothetical protein ABI761_01025 [Saprospiraceae bacterium]
MPKLIVFLTGASGVGKTTLMEQLQLKYNASSWAFLHFDSIGVPSLDEMINSFGSPSNWQEQITYTWIDKLLLEIPNEVIFFEGQVNLNFIQKGFKKHNFTNYRIILIDCNEAEMTFRLIHKRKQPELLTDDMKNWLDYLRNQALNLNVPVIDTSHLSEQEVLQTFEKLIDLDLNNSRV